MKVKGGGLEMGAKKAWVCQPSWGGQKKAIGRWMANAESTALKIGSNVECGMEWLSWKSGWAWGGTSLLPTNDSWMKEHYCGQIRLKTCVVEKRKGVRFLEPLEPGGIADGLPDSEAGLVASRSNPLPCQFQFSSTPIPLSQLSSRFYWFALFSAASYLGKARSSLSKFSKVPLHYLKTICHVCFPCFVSFRFVSFHYSGLIIFFFLVAVFFRVSYKT